MVNTQRIVIAIVVILLLIFGLIQKFGNDKESESLEKHKVQVQGTITKIKLTGSASGNIDVFYNYVVNGNEYDNRKEISKYCEFYYKCATIPGYINEKVGKLHCVVYYDSTDYTNSRIELDESYCK